MGRALTPDCDVLVVGAGIHGAGVAQAAAAAGYSVVVVERTAPAAGTSSRSSKLIHGGLRYLETAQIALVYESLAERRWMLAHAPALVHLLPMHIPVYDDTRRAPWLIRAGLSAYALLGGLREHEGFRALRPSEWSALDGLDTRRLRAVFRYYEAQTDDAALTRAVLASAQRSGATIIMPAEVVAAEPRGDAVDVALAAAGGARSLRARVVVNAAGPWAAGVAARLHSDHTPPAVELVQGTHLEFGGMPARGAYYVEAPADGRAVFVMPYHGRTLVGTTERAYAGDPARVAPTDDERDYLCATYRRYFPASSTEPVAEWAGLRVLPAAAGAAFGRPRETQFDVRGRVVSIYGGKLTTWRRTAGDALRLCRRALPAPARRIDTRTVPL